MADKPMTLEQHMAALAKEYGTYVAVEEIDIDGVRAFNPGHAVPVSHVSNGLVDKSLVKRADGDAAAANAVSPAVKKD